MFETVRFQDGRQAAGSFLSGMKKVYDPHMRVIGSEDEIVGHCAWLENHGHGRRAEILLEDFCRDGFVRIQAH